ncbi:LysR family transcriptional regulator [Nocardioides silvaticus]|uniref:LysR family transcriptional regulator n=1 Tax=Nocardioides silvaticus TaxID=2201891 RepID=A0A316TJ02_9ACTN|nr:LysR family transcriptional regulator [Nocardioides silvaticus]PWN02314.1 LysR family transcriptional regulator [Nocardioides silvaticus]
MDVDPRRLRFLLAVARYGGVLAAADELRVTASAVSQQIARLEDEVGRSLITRTPTGSVLTPAGLALAEAAEDVERALAVARTRLLQDEEGVSGTVRVGGFQSFLASILAPALPSWRERHPGLRIETFEAEEDDLMRSLRAGQLDAIVVELDADADAFSAPRGTLDTPLLDDPWKLVVPSGALLSTEVIDFGRMSLPWLGVDPKAANAQAIGRVQAVLGGESSAAHTYYSFDYGLALVRAGVGVTLAPSLALERLTTEGIDIFDIPGLGSRRIVLRTLKRASGRTVDTVVAMVRETSASFSRETDS